VLEDIKSSTEKLGRQTHAGAAMIVAAALDRLLEEALVTKMVPLNREMRDKLFGDYGALRHFSAKIDVAFAVGIVSRDTFKLLTAVRKCRNLFAHTNGLLSFESPEIHDIFSLGTTQLTPVVSIEDFFSIAEAIEANLAKSAGLPLQGVVGKLKEDL
jgi:DNA-binding MltR family transcriptional regulator